MIKSNNTNSKYISEFIEQEVGDTDWRKYLPSLEYEYESLPVKSMDSNVLTSVYKPSLGKGLLGIIEDSSTISYARVDSIDGFASYDSISFSVATEDTAPFGLTFNTDGTKMYIMGYTNDSVYQYTLSTAWDLNTATYDLVSFSVGTEDTAPYDITFNTDGTKMYMVGTANDSVYQYSLSTGFDLSTASYDSISFSVATEDTNPLDITFNTDGTKMYMVGSTNDSVYQYTLSTGFDLSTASYDLVSFSVGSEDATPLDITFNPDGTKMYIMGNANDSVYQYSLSTGFDLSTATYDSVSFSVATEDTNPYGITFSADGTKMYIMGAANGSVYQYTVNEANSLISNTIKDISTATYDLVSFSVATEDTNPVGLTFNTDGTKMYIVGVDTDSVHQYSLTTGFDLSTASYDSISFSVATEDANPFDITFNTDGTKMYIVGTTNDSVYQYTLSTAWDLSTASYDSVSFSVASEDTAPLGITFNTDGTKMYMVGNTNDSVYQYTLSTGFDLSTASYDSVSFSVASEDTDPRGITFNTDGTKMYIMGYANDSVYQYTLSTAWDLSSASYDSVSFSVATEDTAPYDITFNPDGTKMYMVGTANDSVYQYTCSINNTLIVKHNSATTTPLDVFWYSKGNYITPHKDSTTTALKTIDKVLPTSKLFYDNTSYIDNLTVSPEILAASDIDFATYDSVSFSVGTEDTNPLGLTFSADGTKMYMVGAINGSVYQYSLTTGFDLSTASYDSVSFSVGTEDTNPVGLTFNTDGTKMYMVGTTNDSVYQYSLTTGFDLSTATYDSVSFNVGTEDTTPYGLTFNTDGTKMYMVGIANDSVYQYSLNTGFDLSTASYDSVSFSVGTEDTAPYDITFNNDGTKMYIMGYANDSVYQYSLTTGFDLSTATYDSISFSVATEDTAPYGLTFNPDGTKMYIVGVINDSVYQYSTQIEPKLGYSIDITDLYLTSLPNQFFLDNTPTLSVILSDTNTERIIDLELEKETSLKTEFTGSFDTDFNFTTGENINIISSKNDSGDLVNGDGLVTTTGFSKSSEGYNIEDAEYDSVSFSVATEDTTPVGLTFNTDGTKMYMVGVANDSVYQYTLSTAWDLSTATYDSISFSVATEDTNPYGITFNTDGTKMYIMGATNDSVYQYSLTTGFDLSTASYDSVSFSVASEDTDPVGLTFNTDGTKMYMVGNTNDSVYQYSLSTGFDLSTASYDSVSFSVASEDTTPRGLTFNTDGTKMYMVGATNDSVYQYSLTTGFDLSTATYDSVSFSVTTEDTNPLDITFSADGTKMYIMGNVNDSVYQYTTEKLLFTFNFDTLTNTPEKVIVPKTNNYVELPNTNDYSTKPFVTNYGETVKEGRYIQFALEAQHPELTIDKVNIDLWKKV